MCLGDCVLVSVPTETRPPCLTARNESRIYCSPQNSLDFTAGTVDQHVNIHPDGPWRKAEAKPLTLLPDLPVFLRRKKLGNVDVK